MPIAVESSPIPFVTIDTKTSNYFVISDEAKNLLSSLDAGSIAVITVAGLYRTGKSFILNQLAGRQSGFHIGASVEPCTQGLWIWHVDTEKTQLPGIDSEIRHVLLLDTEGLGSYTRTQEHDIKVFTLALLLSSLFIYNALGTIDDTAMDNLSLMVELTERLRSTSTKDQQSDLSMPPFVWLLRDFSLDLIVEGRQVTPTGYLEHALAPLTGSGDDMARRNAVRDCLKRYFVQRACYTLRRPVDDEEQLQNIGSLPSSALRPEYLSEVQSFIEAMYHQLPPKRVCGHLITGAVFLELAELYTNALNAPGGVPAIRSSWENVAENKCRLAVHQAEQIYEKEISQALSHGSIEVDALIKTHWIGLRKARDEFLSKAVGENILSWETKLLENVKISLDGALQKNDKDSVVLNEELIQGALSGLAALVEAASLPSNDRSTPFTIDQLEHMWTLRLALHSKDNQGPARFLSIPDSRLLSSLFSHCRTVISDTERFLKAEKASAIEATNSRAKSEYDTLQKLYDTVDATRREDEDRLHKLRHEHQQLTMALAASQQQLKALKAESEADQEKHKKLINEAAQKEADRIKEEAVKAQDIAARLQREKEEALKANEEKEKAEKQRLATEAELKKVQEALAEEQSRVRLLKELAEKKKKRCVVM